MKKIQSIVEGQGEVGAVPILLRRLLQEAGVYSLDPDAPLRKPGADFREETRLGAAVRQARRRADCAAILILFDGDGDCPKDRCPQVQQWARSEAGPIPCEVVMAYRRGPDQMSATGYEQQLAKSSGVVVRDWLAPKKIKGTGGKVTGIDFVRTKLDAKGKLVETKDTVTIACDMVLKAVGQTLLEKQLAGLELSLHLRRVAGQPVERSQRDVARSALPPHRNDCV